MLRRRPSQVPLGAESEARRALLGEGVDSPSSSSTSRRSSSARRRKLLLSLALAVASAVLFGVGVVLGASRGGEKSVSASARSLLASVFSSPSAFESDEKRRSDSRRPPSVPRRAGAGVGSGSDGAVDDDGSGPIEAYLVVYSHVDPGWLLTVDEYYEKGYKAGQNGVRKILDEIVPVLEKTKAAPPSPSPSSSPSSSSSSPSSPSSPSPLVRKYTWGETVYLERWWRDQSEDTKDRVRALVKSGQLSFAGGGWVSPDEATAHYSDVVDQYALGHRWLSDELGLERAPSVGWQIDTFGHSQAHAALLGSLGVRSVYFSRIDTEDRLHRASKRQLEFLWDAAPGRSPASLESELWCYAFHRGQYDIPLELEDLQVDVGGRRLSGGEVSSSSRPAPLLSSLTPEQVEARWEQRLANVTSYVREVAERTRGSGRGPVMVSVARDFGWDDPGLLYDNLDELIARAAADPKKRVSLRYATAEEHADARRRGRGLGRGGKKKGVAGAGGTGWPVQQGDLMPYSDCKGCYWSGYFSTRPGTKRLVRESSGLLSAARQLEAWVGGDVARGAASSRPPSAPPTTVPLERAVALMQHHDAITGTDRLDVNRDYRRVVSDAAAEARTLAAAALGALVLGGARDPSSSPASPPSVPSTFWGSHETSFALCEAANASVCTPAVKLSDAGGPFTVAAYNSLPRATRALVRVPLGPRAAKRSWKVSAPDVAGSGSPLLSGLELLPSGDRAQVVPLSPTDEALRELAEVDAGGGGPPPSSLAAGYAAFDATLPPLGYVAFALEPEEGGEGGGSAVGVGKGTPPLSSPCSSFPANCTEDDTSITLSNGLVDLVFAKKKGVILDASDVAPSSSSGLARVRSRSGGDVVEASVRASLLSYGHELKTSILPWFLRRSGHYAFHPDGEAKEIDADPDSPLESLVVGPLLSQVTRKYGSYGELTFRLVAGSSHFEVEWTVGPLPSPQDVVVRFETDLESASSSSPTVFVDSNGREFLKRQRGARSTWALAPLRGPKDSQFANDVARDYYPMTSGAYIEDGDGAGPSPAPRQLSIVPDRSQGVASLRGGQLEAMLHREASISDELGNPETLRDVDARGRAVVVRGKHLVALTSRKSGAAKRRSMASVAVGGGGGPLVAFSARPPASAAAAAGALLAAELPPSVELLKLAPRRRGGGTTPSSPDGVELRLAHAFEEGEDGASGGGAGVNGGRDGSGPLSRAVDVDLAAALGPAFAPFEVADLTLSGLDKRASGDGAPPGASLPHGERIFNGPLLFDYDRLDAPGRASDGAGGRLRAATPPETIPKPPPRLPSAVRRGDRVVRLEPLEIKTLALTRPGGGGGGGGGGRGKKKKEAAATGGRGKKKKGEPAATLLSLSTGDAKRVVA